MSYELAILGAGNMAEAIVRGVLSAKRMSARQIIVADVAPARRELFDRELRVKATENNQEAVGDARTVLLSVKPQQMQDLLGGVGSALRGDALIISIAAGISTEFIQSTLGSAHKRRIVRAMPNTPMLVGEGMVAIAAGEHATADDLATTRNLFDAAASVIEVEEDKIDAVTAVSGSGPAYFFFLVEQMIRAGNELGLTAEQAKTLALKTALGAAKMLMTSTDSPQELRRKVTSPGGTTAAAIGHMESNDLGKIIVQAMKAAQRRSKELGK